MISRQQSLKLIPPHGGYRDLQSYQMSEIVYDAAVVFCDRFILKRSLTHDQMVQVEWKGCSRHVTEEGRRRTGLGKIFILDWQEG